MLSTDSRLAVIRMRILFLRYTLMQSFRIFLNKIRIFVNCAVNCTQWFIEKKDVREECPGNSDPGHRSGWTGSLSTTQVDALLAHQSVYAEREQFQVLLQQAHFHNLVELGLVVGMGWIFIVFSIPRRVSSRVLLPEAIWPTIVTSSPGLTLKPMFLRLKSSGCETAETSRCWWLLTAAVVAGDSLVPVEVKVLDAETIALLANS